MKSLSFKSLTLQLEVALSERLPGAKAHRDMNPVRDLTLNGKIVRRAAVLIVLYKKDDCWTFPLIRRAEDEYVHSGQIALPGGKIEADETASEAAQREAEEEIGLPNKGVNIIGELSPITIPVSGFLVNPIIATIDFEPIWKPNPAEVDNVIPVSISDLHDLNNIRVEQRVFNHKAVQINYFLLQDQKVWGATAMILNEFRLVTRFLQ